MFEYTSAGSTPLTERFVSDDSAVHFVDLADEGQSPVFQKVVSTTYTTTIYLDTVADFPLALGLQALGDISEATAPVRIQQALQGLESIAAVAEVTGSGTQSDPWVITYSSTGATLADVLGSSDSNVHVGTTTVASTTYRQEMWHDGEADSRVYGSTYHVQGLVGSADDLRLVDSGLSADGEALQELVIAGTAGQHFTLKLGSAGQASADIELVSDGNGTAQNIQAQLNALTNQQTQQVEVSYDAANQVYKVSGLDSTEVLQLATGDGVTVGSSFTQDLVLGGATGQNFSLKFGAAGTATGNITIGASAAATATAIQAALRQLSGFGSLNVDAGATPGSYRVSGFTAAQGRCNWASRRRRSPRCRRPRRMSS